MINSLSGSIKTIIVVFLIIGAFTYAKDSFQKYRADYKVEGKTAQEWHEDYVNIKKVNITLQPYARKSMELETCVEEETKLYKGVAMECASMEGCAQKIISNGGVDVLISKINEAKANCFDEVYR